MENKATFTSFWNRNCHDASLPDLDFFDSPEGLQGRVDLCKQNLKEALFAIKTEGLVLRFLSRVLNSNDYEEFKEEICRILRCVFSDTLGFASTLSDDGSDLEVSSTNDLESNSNRNPDTEELFLIRGNSFAFTIDSDKKQQQNRTIISGVEEESESGPSLLGGSEAGAVGEQQFHLPGLAVLHSKTETSADRDVELLNNQNDKVFSGTENLPCDVGRREISSNEYGAVGNTSNQKVLSLARDSQRMDQVEGKATGSNIKDNDKDVGDVPLTSVCGPLKSETLPLNSERRCKWQTEVRPHSTGSCFQVPDLLIPFETKTRGRYNTEGGIEPCDIDDSTKESLETKDTMNSQNIVANISIEGKENIEDRVSNSSEDRPTLAEEETFFVDLSEEKEAFDVPSVVDQETVVVDDLISYLEGIEFENSSEEEDSAASEESGQMLYEFQGKKDSIFRKKQLQSVLSTASGISADSCLSPYALDVAMSEIHSAESSDQEEVATTGSGEPSPVGENTSPSLELPKGGDAPAKPTPPVKPPRRHSKRGMVRAHTVGTPKEIKTQSRGYLEEDEVFGKEEGYDGDQENQVLSQSHSNISTANKIATVQYRSLLATGEEERRKLRRSRGSNVILDEDNIDFPSSPLSSPGNSAKEIEPKEVNNDDALKLQNRKWVASAVVDSEKAYLECLNMLCKYMKPIKASLATTVPILSTQDFNKIFFKIEELFKMHEKFYHDLELRISNWNIRQIIGDLFLSLVYQFSVYQEYMQNYKIAIDTIHKCKSNDQFNQIFSKEFKLSCCEEKVSLESLFSRPVDRIGRYVTSLNDLLKQTPKNHPDHDILLEVQVVTQDFLAKISTTDQKDGTIPRIKRDHRLMKDGFLVELTDGIRKFRHLFLFNDVLLCTKRKVTARHEQYVCKWYLSLSEIMFHPHENSEATQIVPVASEPDLDLLKGKIVSLKSEIRKEQGTTGQGSGPDESPSTKRKRAQSTNKTIEKLKKKVAQQEAALLLATPSLPFHLYNKHLPKTYTLLCKSDVERADWKEGMLSQIKQGPEIPPGYHLSVFELQSLLEACKKLRTCKTLGKVSIVEDKELLNGLLYIDIQNGKGFHRNDLYCVIEVDHYGQFVRKAKTKICKTTGDPVWNQDFDIEVEGSKEFRLHVYGKSRYGLMSDEECGLGKITLTRENLTDQKKRTITISLDKQGAVTLSIQYSKTLQGIQRKKSVSDDGVFGVDIAIVTSREEFDIPLIVIGCVREVEKRGTEEVGIYRLSGASSDLRRLKDAFNENSQSALVSISETDIHAVSGLLKLYLRELPEPLFTDQLYNDFVEAYGISDKEDKKERMLELINSLPTPNKLTALYLFDHLRRVADCSDVHRMSINNLATIFGPNVLRPSTKTSSPMDLAQGTLDVMSQVGIFLYFLKLDSDDVRLPNDPELKSRLNPTKSFESSDFEDRLI